MHTTSRFEEKLNFARRLNGQVETTKKFLGGDWERGEAGRLNNDQNWSKTISRKGD